jgi:hypothetical protein
MLRNLRQGYAHRRGALHSTCASNMLIASSRSASLPRRSRGAVRCADDTPCLSPVLGLNGEMTLLTPLLTAVGLALGAMVG